MSSLPPLPSDDTLIGLNRSATTAQLLSGAVHEVNNALQVISGTVEILEGRSDLPDPVLRSLERLRGQSERAAAALAQVLVFTKAPRSVRERVNLREVVAGSVALRHFAIRRAGLTIAFEADSSTAFGVHGNRGELQQLVLNLIVNAEQALREGGAIRVALTAADGWLTLGVYDTGSGIAIEPREKAFEPFVSTREASDFAGLGLWTARVIAERHGGTVTLDQRPDGHGVVVRLPSALPASRAV